MDSKAFKDVLDESEPLWNGKFPSIASTSSGFGDESGRAPTAAYDENLWRVGWTDGASGQHPDEGVKLIQAHDADRRHRATYELNHLKAQADSRATACKQKIERASTDLEDSRTELLDLEGRRRTDPQEFSLFTGLLYVLIAFILIASDMPLSLSLVAEGFDLKTSHEIEATQETIRLGDIFSSQWRAVLQHLWQPIVLATGIASLGIFFKIVTDYFLSSVEGTTKSPTFATVFRWLRGGFFFLAFALMIIGLWSVGTLRSRQQALDTVQESRPTQQPGARVAEDPATQERREKAEADEKAKLDALERVKTEAVEYWTDVSFILLAITLPLVGGICFSVGWKRVQRFGQLWSARVLSEWRGWRIDRAREKQGVWEADAAFLEQELDRGTTRGEEADLTALGVYMHGYWRGFTMPQRLDPHRSLYVHCKDVLRQWIAAGVQETAMDRSLKFGRGRK